MLLALLFLDPAASAQASGISGEPPETFARVEAGSLPPFDEAPARPRHGVAVDRRFSLGVERTLLELKASYLDLREDASGWNVSARPQRRRHLSLLATSHLSGKLAAEAEIAYGSLDSAEGCGCEAPPRMLRLALKGSAGGFGYGADFRAIDQGFAPPSGTRFGTGREQVLFWSERSLGPLRLRGSLEEIWEKLPLTGGERPVRNAGLSLSWNRQPWRAAIASGYSERDGEEGPDTRVFTHTLSASYQASPALGLASQFSVANEREEAAGGDRRTPSLRLSFGYSPLRAFKLTGYSSFGWMFGAPQARMLPSRGAGAGLEWRIGSSRALETTLSFRLEYSLQPDPAAASHSLSRFSSLFRLNLAPKRP